MDSFLTITSDRLAVDETLTPALPAKFIPVFSGLDSISYPVCNDEFTPQIVEVRCLVASGVEPDIRAGVNLIDGVITTALQRDDITTNLDLKRQVGRLILERAIAYRVLGDATSGCVNDKYINYGKSFTDFNSVISVALCYGDKPLFVECMRHMVNLYISKIRYDFAYDLAIGAKKLANGRGDSNWFNRGIFHVLKLDPVLLFNLLSESPDVLVELIWDFYNKK